ncbi:uncharacterized protein LOC110717256 [Chenopodium quinoa]|uniref:uncharacterized protein LOC110717256 n=1 Tax=Chenopodium quinoa TaxID=63459 RepID=UPI000B76E6A5|nr:uncharacterized protein LOC110717256 [Chenopodium quinoa]
MVDDTKIDPASLFYLGSGDQPGNLITNVILKSDNYLSWSRAISLSLKSRRKFGFVDGTISKPTDKKKLLDWDTVNSMLVSWILRTIDPKLAISIPYFDDAKRLWDYLDKRYCDASGPRLQQLRASITNCKQLSTMTVEDYYNQLIGYFDDLARLKPPHGCECGACSCGVAAKYEKDRDEEILHQFLVGIDDAKYALVRTNLLSQQPPATLERSYHALLQEEHSRSIAQAKIPATKEDAHVFALPSSDRRQFQSARVDKAKLFCSHCKRSGHDTTGCFLLHGFPDWWLEKYGKKGGASHSGSSVSQQGSKHSASASTAAVAASSSKPVARANAMGGSIGPPVVPSTDTLSALSELKPEHVRLLLNMVTNNQQEKMSGEYFSSSWIIDTGTSHHVTGDASCLVDMREILSCPVGLPDGTQALATKEGRVYLADGIILEHVLFVAQLHCNLLSVSKMIDDSHCYVRFTDSLCAIQDQHSGSLIGGGERIDELYYFRRLPKVCALTSSEVSTFELWHRRLGHPSDPIVKLVPAVSASSSSKFLNKACEICPQAKQSRDIFPNSDSRASRIFELIHCDLWGSYKTPSTCGAHYFLTIVDDFSRGVWVYLLNDKTEVYSSFLSFFAMIKCQFDVHVKYVRSDNGTEFKPMLPYFNENGILFQTSCVGIPQQNGRVERKHQHILNVSRALMFQGYPHGKKGWKLYDLDTGEIFVSRDVKFFENEFPFVKGNEPVSSLENVADMSHENVGVDHDFLDDLEYILEVGEGSLVPEPQPPTLATSPATARDSSPHRRPPAAAADTAHTAAETAGTDSSTTAPNVAAPTSSTAPTPDLGRGQRPRQAPGWHRDYVAHTITLDSPSISPCSPSAPSSSGTPYLLAHFVNCTNFSVPHRVFIAAVDSIVEPRNFNEAMKHDGWREAMQKEISALEKNKTWVMEELPPGKKALGCRWVYKVKLNSDGTIERLKAHLVIFGNHQVEGIDYNETFAPVAKMVTVRAFLAVASAKNWELHQMDVHNAFLHGDLDEEVYMKLPPGFHGSHSGLVCRLLKSLYGLRQAPRCWFSKLASSLKRYSFIQSYSDYSLFTLQSGAIQLSVLVYVDDLIISENDSSAISSFKSYLSDCFHMKDLGVLKYFLDIEVDCYYLRDAIQDGIISPSYVKTTDQLADIFTKALNKQQFMYLLGKLGICELEGGCWTIYYVLLMGRCSVPP